MNKPKYEVKLMPQLEKACGLDLHKDKIVGFISDKEGRQQEMKEFGTFTDDLFQIKEWLFANGIDQARAVINNYWYQYTHPPKASQ